MALSAPRGASIAINLWCPKQLTKLWRTVGTSCNDESRKYVAVIGRIAVQFMYPGTTSADAGLNRFSVTLFAFVLQPLKQSNA